MINKTLETEEELIEFAREFTKNFNKGDIIFLNGPLGAGKTTFVKGIALGLEIEKVITSPTFQIIKQYDNKLCHIDAYRTKEEEIGVMYYKNNDYIICIEWAENLLDYIKPDYIMDIEYDLKGRKVLIKHYE